MASALRKRSRYSMVQCCQGRDDIHGEARERSYGLIKEGCGSVRRAHRTRRCKADHQRAQGDQEGTRGVSCLSHKSDWVRSRRSPTRTSTPPMSRKPTKHGSKVRSWSARREAKARRDPSRTWRGDARQRRRLIRRRVHHRTSQCRAGRDASPEADRDGPGRIRQPALQRILDRIRGSPAIARTTGHHRHQGHRLPASREARTRRPDAHRKRSHGVVVHASNVSPPGPAHDPERPTLIVRTLPRGMMDCVIRGRFTLEFVHRLCATARCSCGDVPGRGSPR